jgi:hypothetical protein
MRREVGLSPRRALSRSRARWLGIVLSIAGVLASAPVAQGASWHIVPPSTDVGFSGLTDVSASSATNVWAVGENLALRWNGTGWISMPLPDFEPRHVVALSPTSVIAQGGERVARWDGTSWHTLPAPPSFALFDISARSASDVWLVGLAPPPVSEGCVVMHWNGAAWNDVASSTVCKGDDRYANILEISPTSVWMAGWVGDEKQTPVIAAHWNGASWMPAFAPDFGHAALEGMGGTAGQIWITGLKSTPNANSQWGWAAKINTSQVWNRIGYTPEWDAAGRSHVLYDIDAHASNSAWAVGYRLNAAQIWKTWTVHWNGSSWVDLGGPNAGTADTSNYLRAVTIVPGTTADVWAVGTSQQPGHNPRTLILHWS